MSPVAMLLTGFTVAQIDLKKTLSKLSVYWVSVLRLAVYPLAAIGVFVLIRLTGLSLPDSYVICAICALACSGLRTLDR
jgi:predicted permease